MNRHDYLWITGFGLLGVWVWCRDTGWTHQFYSTLPVLLSFLWYIWLVGPWELGDDGKSISLQRATCSVIFISLGILTDINLLLSIGWALIFFSWIESKFAELTIQKARSLILLVVMAFPWMALDGDWVSSFFRITAAQCTEYCFSLIGFTVERTGTNLWIQGLPVSVNEACSGLGVLQAMMISGVVVLEAVRPQKNRILIQLPFLILVAWIANTMRVIGISVAALTWGVDFAGGPFHTWGGMAILSLVFVLAWGMVEYQAKENNG